MNLVSFFDMMMNERFLILVIEYDEEHIRQKKLIIGLVYKFKR